MARRPRQEQPQGEATFVSPRCFAAGCPLPGGISESRAGGGPWFCRFHYGEQAARWPGITLQVQDDIREMRLDATGKVLPAADTVSPTVGAMLAAANARRRS